MWKMNDVNQRRSIRQLSTLFGIWIGTYYVQRASYTLVSSSAHLAQLVFPAQLVTRMRVNHCHYVAFLSVESIFNIEEIRLTKDPGYRPVGRTGLGECTQE